MAPGIKMDRRALLGLGRVLLILVVVAGVAWQVTRVPETTAT